MDTPPNNPVKHSPRERPHSREKDRKDIAQILCRDTRQLIIDLDCINPSQSTPANNE